MTARRSDNAALNLIEDHLARIAAHFCPPAKGEPSPFEERLAKIAAEAKGQDRAEPR